MVPETDFRGTDLRGFDFGFDDLSGYDFTGCDLRGANLESAIIHDAIFEKVIFDDQTRWPIASSDSQGDGRAALLASVEAWLNHKFVDRSLLTEALTHPSATRRSMSIKRDNQRLEFLGDRVLGLVIAHVLMVRFPNEEEGPLSRRHNALVRRETLAQIAGHFGLGDALIISSSEMRDDNIPSPSILADALEALVAALYLDAGLAPVERFVHAKWQPYVQRMGKPPSDPKSQLQEWSQARALGLPSYRLLKTTGPAHAPTFEVQVKLADLPPKSASASSKRKAERAAARALLAQLQSS